MGRSQLVHLETGATADEAGIAARMLLHVRDLDTARATAIETEERKYLDLINVMRALTAIFGTGTT